MEEQIIAALLNDPDVSALVGNKVYPGRVPQGVLPPAIVFNTVASDVVAFWARMFVSMPPVLRKPKLKIVEPNCVYCRLCSPSVTLAIADELVMSKVAPPANDVVAVQVLDTKSVSLTAMDIDVVAAVVTSMLL